jgi:hypothetical protein
MASRLNDGTPVSFAQWESKILALKDLEPEAKITIETAYNTSNRTVTLDIKTTWLKDGDGGTNYKLQVHLIEDHISDWQLNNGVDIPDYDHRHVLRDAVNTTWGSVITNTALGAIAEKTYTYTLNAAWNEANCEIVAFIYKESPSYEVMQVNTHHVIE